MSASCKAEPPFRPCNTFALIVYFGDDPDYIPAACRRTSQQIQQAGVCSQKQHFRRIRFLMYTEPVRNPDVLSGWIDDLIKIVDVPGLVIVYIFACQDLRQCGLTTPLYQILQL